MSINVNLQRNRLCKICEYEHTNETEDEIHFELECEEYSQL